MQYFTQSTVQLRVKDFFTHSIEGDRLAHAYIFYGSEGRGKEAFAFELAKAINCTDASDRPCNTCPSCTKINRLSHPDVKYIFPVSSQTKPEQIIEILKEKAENPYLPINISGHKSISIEAIRELKNEAKYASFEAGKRAFIIYGAEYFSREAANSFLKLLEEPPQNLYMILITNEIHALLDTIRSRCQPVYFPELRDQDIKNLLTGQGQSHPDLDKLIRIGQHNIKQIYYLLNAETKELRLNVYDYIKAAAAGNYYSVSQIIDEVTRKRDKNFVMDFIKLLSLWFRDSLHFSILKNDNDFVNLDYSEKITKFAEFYKNVDMEKIIKATDEAYLQIKLNVHPALTLTNLAIQIKRLLIPPILVKIGRAHV